MRCRLSRHHLQLLCAVALLESCGCGDVSRLLRSRQSRALLYPDPRGSETKVQVLFGLGLPMEGEDVSMTLGYVVKCNYNLPYNASDFTNGPVVSETRTRSFRDTQQNENLQPSGVSRWSLYRMLEGLIGKGCLLRAVCEAASLPFSPRDGPGVDVLGQLLHALLTPSATQEQYEVYADCEYHVAEAQGRGRGRGCELFRNDCLRSPLDYFTRIIDDY